MTFKDEQRAIGREAIVRIKDLEISVIVRDVRLRPYAVDYLVEPTAGSGMTWFDRQQVRFVKWSD